MFSCEDRIRWYAKILFFEVHQIVFLQYIVLRNSGINPRNKTAEMLSFHHLLLPDADNEPNSSKNQLFLTELWSSQKKLSNNRKVYSRTIYEYNIARITQKTSIFVQTLQ